MDARQQLREAGIAPDRLTTVEAAVRDTALDMFDAYDIDLPDADPVIARLQTHLFVTIVDQAQQLDEPLVDRFELIEEEVTAEGTAARSNLTFLVSDIARTEDASSPLKQLSMAFVAQNYEHASPSSDEGA